MEALKTKLPAPRSIAGKVITVDSPVANDPVQVKVEDGFAETLYVI